MNVLLQHYVHTFILNTHTPTQYINQLKTAIISEASCRYFEIFTI